jgi:hypothetical protein
MGDLRKPFFFLAVVAIGLVVLVELGSSLLIGGHDVSGQLLSGAGDLGVDVGDPGNVEAPPGRGIEYLALIDAIALYTAALMGASLIIPEKVHGRLQGIVTLIGSIILILVALVLLIIAFIELMIMVSLFLAVPFGTIAYLAIWGFFPRGWPSAPCCCWPTLASCRTRAWSRWWARHSWRTSCWRSCMVSCREFW